MGLISFHEVYRDAIQSRFGTNPSAEEITEAHPNAHLSGVSSIQTGGGTFFDSFARKGRNEWQQVNHIFSFYKKRGVRQTALIRGDFLFGFEPQPFDVVKATVLEFARMGVNVLQNFHGLNDLRVLKGVAEAARIAREEEGHDINVRGSICIDANRNVRLDDTLRFAEKMLSMGHDSLYLKSASGRLNQDTVYRYVGKLLDEFGVPIGVHVHSTYGEAPACYMTAIEAAIERKKPIEIDVQHPAMAGFTAHPSMLKMRSLIANHPNPEIRANVPELNIEAIKADMESLYMLAYRYRGAESEYDRALLDSMRAARAPGGATATLKSINGLVSNLSRLLGTDDWTKIQKAIYDMQRRILPFLGDPTQVTPYAANTTGQAALSLWSELEERDIFSTLYPGIVNYLIGKHGRLPETVDRSLQAKALAKAGLKKPVEYIPSQERTDKGLDEAKVKLRAAGIENPSVQQMISAAVLDKGVEHVIRCEKGENNPQPRPNLPENVTPHAPDEIRMMKDGVIVKDIRDAITAIGGPAALQEIADRALHLKQIDDHMFIFPEGEKNLEQEWRQGNLKKLSSFINAIPNMLKKAGFDEAAALSGTLLMDNIHRIIQQTCDERSKGLYEYMIKEIAEYKMAASSDPRMERGVEPALCTK